MSKILTISVAAYNIEPYINELMDSIIQANCMDDLEILIINDGSKDQTSSLAYEYVKAYPNSVKLVEKENGGHGSTINKGIELATGKYFRALDGDDWVNSNNLRDLVSLLKKADADMIVCDYDKCFSDGKNETQKLGSLVALQEYSFSEAISHIKWICYHNIVYKTNILKDNNIHLDEHCFYVDTEYDLFPIPYINTLLYFSKPVYCYRLGIEGQSVSPTNRMKNIKHGHIVTQSLLELYSQRKEYMSDAQKKYIAFGIADHCAWNIQSYFFFPVSRSIQKEIIDYDLWIKERSMDVFRRMEKLGKDSRSIVAMRRTKYALYWLIKMYKSMKTLYLRTRHI